VVRQLDATPSRTGRKNRTTRGAPSKAIVALCHGAQTVTTSLSDILKNTSFTAVAAFIGIILGLIKNAFIAARYGTGLVYDAFLIAANLPLMIMGFALNGATNLVPILAAELKDKPEEEAWDIGSRMLSFWIILVLLFTMVALFLVPLLVHMLAPGFSDEQRALAHHISYIILWSAVFSGFAALATLISYTYHEFTTPALSGIVNNMVIIAVLASFATHRIDVLAVAVVLGSVAQLLIQYKALAKVKCFFRFRIGFRHPVIRRVIQLSVPQYIGQGGVALSTAIDRGFASLLPSGAVSAISYGLMVAEIPITVFISAISRVYYPIFSHHANDQPRFQDNVRTAANMIILIIFPISLGLIALGTPIIRLLFERGEFTAESTALTVSSLTFLAIGLLGEGLNAIGVNAYFARQNTVTPMTAGLVRTAVLIALNFLLVHPMGISGLALSTSIASYVKLGVLIFFMRRKIGVNPQHALSGNVVKVGFASLLMAAAVAIFSHHLASYWPAPSLRQQIIFVGSSVMVGASMYVGLLFLLGVKEVSTAYAFMLEWINEKRFAGKAS
jgi:putative peptidoglycan lipid II flippase